MSLLLQVGAELKNILTKDELLSMLEGFGDSMTNKSGDERELLTTYGPKLNEILTARASEKVSKQKELSANFIAEYLAKNPSAKQTGSGLIYHEIVEGTGAQVSLTIYFISS